MATPEMECSGGVCKLVRPPAPPSAAANAPAAGTAAPSNPILDGLGVSELLGNSGSVPVDSLRGKHLALYFSAHWCPPCRGFTPELAKLYRALKDSGRSDFEFIFISSDRDEESFNEYRAEMPWLALPFAQRDAKTALSKKFKVRGIPTLVTIAPDGATISRDAREAADEDPTGANFPWAPLPPKHPLDLIGEGGELLSSTGTVAVESLRGKHLALYFSAHWCPPCRGFTPELAKTYAALKASGRSDFEFIFISSDRDEESFNEYRAEMPWLALPFAQRDTKAALSKQYNVQGIPTLVTVAPDGSTINGGARGAVGGDPTGARFPWQPEALVNLEEDTECGGLSINDAPSLIAFLEGCDAKSQAAAIDTVLRPAAEAQAAATKAGGEPLLCFYARGGGGVVSRVRELCQLGGTPAPGGTLVILDIEDDGAFYVSDATQVTAATVEAFVSTFKDGKRGLTRKQLSRG